MAVTGQISVFATGIDFACCFFYDFPIGFACLLDGA